ncbi:ketol-acid reductoisomerase [Neoehrlichia mikurensis]|uniref:Ketol-acid reductoisomerase n=1 Tax=Neoehrlichia mikurensis TaxID=89586 RepID=A0A9Q9C1S5_9RICK|nr:ketol-acid reductoisomerase [Neoehrlichia mikurensis]QXK92313.1 ketol-acid reductoisomerase [Neoehrlichia mikurensis]QXK92767.1 ketol-acid reductoisomerase [Neoehrlichia mikurensis]QXK94008.1 ketol-acid reductoisomerase [Neoehrlichia mikurensis]UTO55829.1 ketol-acid reductoisomerase [Neoehrlichia mikurensis]UTO56744.1 ketol-acid reductoisomerase [Neoehrlichia mikurensis]
MNIYSYKDSSYLKEFNITILGYGSQGRAHALNLRDSGVGKINIILYDGSDSIDLARKDGFPVSTKSTVISDSDIIVLLAPDELHYEIYENSVKPFLKPKQTLIVAHGFSIYYKHIKIVPYINVCMVSPKAIGSAVRSQYLNKKGVVCFVDIEQDYTKTTELIMNSYASAVTLGNIIMRTTLKEEVEVNLFSEQVVLCGGIPFLVNAAFEVLVNAGLSPELAYFGCLHEVKLITDLMYEKGIYGVFNEISNTAEYGANLVGNKIINESVKQEMKKALAQIQDKSFVCKFLQEHSMHFYNLNENRKKIKDNLIDQVGNNLRKLMKDKGML